MLVDRIMGGLQSMANITGIKHVANGMVDLASGQYKQGAKNIAEGSVRSYLSLVAFYILSRANEHALYKSIEREQNLAKVARFKTPIEQAESFCDKITVVNINHERFTYDYLAGQCVKDFFELPKETFDSLIENHNAVTMTETTNKIARYCHDTLHFQNVTQPFETWDRSRVYVNCIKNILNNDSKLLHRLT